MNKRVITAIVCVPLLLLFVILGGWWLAIPLLLLGGLGIYEYHLMILRMRPENILAWRLIGIAYILLGFISIFGMRMIYGNWLLILWLLLTIWSTDIAAYEFGRRFGRKKLAPNISPNKTVEGAISGAVAAMLLAGTYFSIVFKMNFFLALLLTLFISCLGQLGDLLESQVKRMAGVKDSGSIFPGHGGVLDRFDSLLLAAPVAYILMLLVSGG